MAGEIWDAANQQVVRADSSAPWEEGDGGDAAVPDNTLPEPEAEGNGVTKQELLDQARELGASPANAAMSKAELQAAIDEKLAEE